jgi:hypothetical protein
LGEAERLVVRTPLASFPDEQGRPDTPLFVGEPLFVEEAVLIHLYRDLLIDTASWSDIFGAVH